ncbi:MAG: hypothetical protein SGILL_002206 [Bacillariaceae sp.]
MQLTETILDELCVGVEQDLLAGDDNYNDLIRMHRRRSKNRSSSVAGTLLTDDDTVLSGSSSLGTLSLLNDNPEQDLEVIRKEGISSIVQTLLFRRKEKKETPTEDNDNSRSPVKPSKQDPKDNCNLDSVEVESNTEGFSVILDKKRSLKASKPSIVQQQQQDQPSLASTEVATDSSSSEEEEEEAFPSQDHDDQDDGTIETLENGKVTIKDFTSNGDVMELEHFPTIKESSNHDIELEHFPSFIDLSNVVFGFAPRSTSDISSPKMERQARSEEFKKRFMETSNVIEGHLKQRKAVYLWSMSVLQQKLDEHGEDTNMRALLDSKPRSIDEYDQTILLALGYAMTGGSDRCNLVVNTKSRRLSVSKYVASVGSKSKRASLAVKDSLKSALVPLKLRKQVVAGTSPDSTMMLDWQQVGVHLAAKAALTTKKSIRFVRNEVILDTMYIARQLTKRAIKLHETLSLLKVAHRHVQSGTQSSIPISIYDESIHSSMDVSMQASEQSIELEENIDMMMIPEESVEVVEPLPKGSRKSPSRRISKALKKQISEKVSTPTRKLRQRLKQQASTSTCSKWANVSDLKREMVMYHMEQEDEEDEVALAFEVAAM